MPRHTTPVKKLPSGRWQIRYRDPSGAQRKETFATSREAHNRLTATRADIGRGAYVDPVDGSETFGSFAKRWAAGRDWKATSRESWERVSRRLGPLDRLPLLAVDRLCLEALQTELLDRYARRTVELTMTMAKSVMKAAYASGRIGRDPTIGLTMPKVRAGESDGRVRPIDVPTREEVVALLAATPERYRAAVALGVTGLRIGEVLAVSADRLDLDRRRLLIDRQLQRIGNEVLFTGPKAEKVRTISLPGAVVLELRRHLRDHQGAGVLFRGMRGVELMRRDAFYSSAWHPALKGAGFERDRFKFHSLRHFAASSMLAEGAPVTAVAGHLGDTVETVQRTYAHWLRDDWEVPSMVLDRVLRTDSVDEVAERLG